MTQINCLFLFLQRSAPSGSFLDKLERVKSFEDLYREFRVPKSQWIPEKKKLTKPTVLQRVGNKGKQGFLGQKGRAPLKSKSKLI